MNVAQYTFQTPSTSQVQVGRIDPSSVKEEKSQQSPKNTDTTQNATNSFKVDTSRALDIYA